MDVIDPILSLSAQPGDTKFITSAAEFNLALQHIVLLLEEADTLFQRQGYSTCAFLAITAIEESAKAHGGLYSSGGGADPESRKGNSFFNHRKKHELAAVPTIPMGRRLGEAIGSERLDELLELMKAKGLVALREGALYFDRAEGNLRSPRSVVTKSLARELLLLAIEVFDDGCVGYSDESLKLSQRTDLVFERLAADGPGD